MSTFFENLLAVSLDAAPWLLFGLIVAGLIKVLIPVAWLNRWLGGPGIMPVINAALLGTPLPLCSCSVVPAALAIRRSGATRGATTSFLIATPENGADSIALSYALLGPVLMIARPVAAIVIAVATGFSVSLFVGESDHTASKSNDTESNTQTPSCCESEKPEPEKKSCCCSGGSQSTCSTKARIDFKAMFVECYQSMKSLFDDIAFWLMVGLLLAALINTFVSQGQIASWGSGLPAMVLMVLVGIPMYICATSSTPVAASMLIAGVSPGTVLVFLLAGPATNLGTVGIIRKELGNKTAAIYLIGVAVGSIAFGLGLDALIGQMNLGNITEQVHEHGQMLPTWLSYGAMGLLGAAMLVKFVSYWRGKFSAASSPKSCCSSTPASVKPSSCCASNLEALPATDQNCCSSKQD